MEELFYLKDTRTEKYHSIHGLTDSIKEASKFTILQLHARLGVTKTYKKVFIEKMKNSFLVMEPVTAREPQFKLACNIPHTKYDILFCEARYEYGLDVITENTTYCEYRGDIKHPKKVNKEPDKITFTVKKIIGECVH